MAFKRVRRARLQADWREIFKPGWGLRGGGERWPQVEWEGGWHAKRRVFLSI